LYNQQSKSKEEAKENLKEKKGTLEPK